MASRPEYRFGIVCRLAESVSLLSDATRILLRGLSIPLMIPKTQLSNWGSRFAYRRETSCVWLRSPKTNLEIPCCGTARLNPSATLRVSISHVHYRYLPFPRPPRPLGGEKGRVARMGIEKFGYF